MGAPVIVPPEWDAIDAVPLPSVIRAADVPRGALHHAISRGQLHPLPEQRAKYGAVLITKDEALEVLMAAAIAAAAGIALATALRAVAAGATFPLTGTA
jgi:hypothetical protein